MKVHNININRKYFEPVREGKINLLIFKKKVVEDVQIGDYILASKGSYEVKAKIKGFSVKAFGDITEKEAQQAGFLTKDFLRDELIVQYDLKGEIPLSTGIMDIDNELFFLLYIDTDEEEYQLLNTPIKVNLYNSTLGYNKEFYNPEYDTKPWRDLA